MLKVVMARGRRLKKGGGDLEIAVQNVATSNQPISEQNVAPLELKPKEQNVASLEMKIEN